jgi:hypothetical protein
VIKKFDHPTLYCEGAAKTHFGWHWMSGGNAFDIFPCETFKDLILEFPFTEAKQMKADFTRVNFGWWKYYLETEPDIYEFGTSRAASWDCPITILLDLPEVEANPRTKDNLEVVRRWEEYRPLLTEEQKMMLRSREQEHTLIKLDGGYALVPYDRVKGTPKNVTAYTFEYEGKAYATLWHKTGEGKLSLSLDAKALAYKDEFLGKALSVAEENGCAVISVSDKAYLSGASREALTAALKNAKLI